MIEISVDRDYGHDESFEAESVKDAARIARELATDTDVRRIVCFADDGRQWYWEKQSGGDFPA